MSEPLEMELLHLNQRLLDAIAAGDWATYQELSDPTLTAFEPEAQGQLVEGLPFHQFYFNLNTGCGPSQTTICAPRVRLLGDNAAVVAYVRLVQKQDAEGRPLTVASEETRVWQRAAGVWRQVHFHRSMC